VRAFYFVVFGSKQLLVTKSCHVRASLHWLRLKFNTLQIVKTSSISFTPSFPYNNNKIEESKLIFLIIGPFVVTLMLQ